MIVKKKEIGSGIPVLCVPVTERTASGIIEAVNRLSQSHADAIEWRVDYYAKSDNVQMVSAILQEIKHLLQDTILIFTYRTAAEGGEGQADAVAYEELLLEAASTGVPDFIDMEFALTASLPMLMSTIRSRGIRVISSFHDFTSTPPVGKMTRKFKDMFAAGADIAKIAVMPRSFSDVCDLLKASRMAHESQPDRAVIAISMGELGALSRLSGEITGSCLTFVTDGSASAPGQMRYEKVKRALTEIHACVTEGQENR